MHKLLAEKGKALLLGNEAVVRGAVEAGVRFASTYPGTPASEIGDSFAEIAKEAGIYFEYSVNEKVAFEAAAGAAMSGVRSLVSFKHYGLNVALDSVLPLAYSGIKGLVIAVADDPNCWSSAQSEQDSRWFARLAHMPMLEPSSAQECKDFTKIAFDISEKFEVPVLLRLTTRTSHMKGVVELGGIEKANAGGFFEKNPKKYINLLPNILLNHEKLLENIEKIRENFEESKLNLIENLDSESDTGIIVSGVAYNYAVDALGRLDLKMPVLKLGLSYPLTGKTIEKFIRKLKTVLVVEEIDDIIGTEVHAIAKDANPGIKILGRADIFPKVGELAEEKIMAALENITGKKYQPNLGQHRKKYAELEIPSRAPSLCPGCPHAAAFFAAKSAAPDAVFGGDIGCYLLGAFPPHETEDFLFSMGASQGVVHGIKKVSGQKTIAFIGDSTFFHAGMPGLLNIVYNSSNPLVIVLDNRATAMTGFQPNPGNGKTALGTPTKEAKIEGIARALGVENVKVVDPFNVGLMKQTINEFLGKDNVSVIVAKRECQLLATKKKKKEGIRIQKFKIDQNKCKKSGACLYQLGCPAIFKEGESFFIDKDRCTGCSVCAQVCPNNAILPAVE